MVPGEWVHEDVPDPEGYVRGMKELIASSFGADAAERWAALRLKASDVDLLAAIGHEVLRNCRVIPGACTLMSALYSLVLEKKAAPPAFVVAGQLCIGESRIFGEEDEIDGERFSQSNPSWNGHAWIVCGDYLADISMFRTAYSDLPCLQRTSRGSSGRARDF
jgi:hypothetical protein